MNLKVGWSALSTRKLNNLQAFFYLSIFYLFSRLFVNASILQTGQCLPKKVLEVTAFAPRTYFYQLSLQVCTERGKGVFKYAAPSA